MPDIMQDSIIEKPTVLSLFKLIPSGIGLDIAKNHTGICIWNGKTIERYGFKLQDYDKTDPFAEYKMRRDFKNKLIPLLNGRYFDYCIVENVYGGDNFDTTRKLLALNTVIDELIFEGVCHVNVEHFYRWEASTWQAKLRKVYKQHGKLKSKIETQGILNYLEDSFYLEFKDSTNSKKEDIFFEDICDATGMLLGVAAATVLDDTKVHSTKLRISNVKMLYLEKEDLVLKVRDKRIKSEIAKKVTLNLKQLEKSILEEVQKNPKNVLCAEVPSEYLGTFGLKHKFTFYDSPVSYLYFYLKK